MKNLKFIHLFSGIGAPESALKRLDIPVDFVGFSEIDKYAITSYRAMHKESQNNLGDIEKIEQLPECDMVMYGSCCQDFSASGKQQGLFDKDGNKTRSGLLLDVERLIRKAKETNMLPKFLLMENVKNLISKKFKPCFDSWLSSLEEIGYNNYWTILNAVDFNVPQNRERVFVVSIRKDIDNGNFKFPTAKPLTKTLEDILEDNVADNFYIAPKQIGEISIPEKFSSLIHKVGKTKSGGQKSDIISTSGVSTCLAASDYKQPKQILTQRVICASRGRNPQNPSDRTVGAPTEQRIEVNSKGVSNTLTTVTKDNYVLEPTENKYNLRKLTPLEYWRLQDFTDEQFYLAKNAGISNTQLYKQAGNSICVAVLENIFYNMFINEESKIDEF